MNSRGSSPLLMVMMLLLAGGAVLQINGTLLMSNTVRINDEYQALQGFSDAQSSLAYGLQLRWPQQNGWQCRQLPPPGGRSCLYRQGPQQGILRGESPNGEKVLWRRVSWLADTDDDQEESGRIQALPAGWSDLCPLADERLCRPV